MAALIALTFAVVLAPPAQAGSTRETSVAYTNGEFWKYSAGVFQSGVKTNGWGRVRERPRVEYRDGQVRGVVDMQIDWPSDCQLSVGFPPSAGASCGSSLRGDNFLRLRSTDITFDFRGPGGTVKAGTCHRGEWNASPSLFAKKPPTRSCYSPWVPMVEEGVYVIEKTGVSGDILHDDAGAKDLVSFTHDFRARDGRIYAGEGRNTRP